MNASLLSRLIRVFVFTFMLFGIASCGLTPTAESADGTPTGLVSTNPPLPASSGASCLVGTWKLTDISSLINSMQEAFSSRGDQVALTDVTLNGSASLTFNSDGSTEASADNFTEGFTMSMHDSTINIPVTILMNGASQGRYSTSAGALTFTDQTSSDLIVTITFMSNSTNVAGGIMGQSGTPMTYQFACSGDTLDLSFPAGSAYTGSWTFERVQ